MGASFGKHFLASQPTPRRFALMARLTVCASDSCVFFGGDTRTSKLYFVSSPWEMPVLPGEPRRPSTLSESTQCRFYSSSQDQDWSAVASASDGRVSRTAGMSRNP